MLQKLLVGCLVSTVFTSYAAACSCMQMTPAQNRDRADAVFTGKVLSEEEAGANVIYTLEVEKSYKGDQSGKVSVSTSNSGAACGAKMTVGSKMLVYARWSEKRLWTSLCDRNAPTEKAAEDIKVLEGEPEAKPAK